MDRLHGSVAPKKATGGPKTRLDASARAELVALVAQQPDATIEALTSTWAERHPDLAVSASTIGRALRQSGLTLKKKRSVRRRGAAKTW
jgi:transposase